MRLTPYFLLFKWRLALEREKKSTNARATEKCEKVAYTPVMQS